MEPINMMITDIKRCCSLSIYTYKARARCNKRYVLLDGLKNVNKCHDAQAIVIKNNAKMYVAFRGSETVADFKDALNVKPVETPIGFVHTGFYDQFLSLQDDIMQEIYSSSSVRDIYFTGHSLGGAVALISGAMLSSQVPCDVRTHCYTYGAPVMGDEQFLESAVNSCDSLRCLELKNDIIPQIQLHPTLQRVTKKDFTIVLDTPLSTSPWDVWGNHSCISYLIAIDNLDKRQRKDKLKHHRDLVDDV